MKLPGIIKFKRVHAHNLAAGASLRVPPHVAKLGQPRRVPEDWCSIRRVLSIIEGSSGGPQFEVFPKSSCVFECRKWVRRFSRSSSNLSV